MSRDAAPRRSLPVEAARRVELLVLDADGVLTDGAIYLSETPGGEVRTAQRFDAQDGLALYLLRAAGIRLAVVSGRPSVPVRARALELGIEEVHQVSAFEKLRAVEGILERNDVSWEEVACLADDLADLPVLERVGLPAAVANAVPRVRAAAVWTTRARGGRGAIREFVEELLTARGDWERVVEEYLEACRGGENGGQRAGEPGGEG
ncbi:MAG: KdsC family phosphatase [Gemmatimonadota bacterium]